MPKKPAHPGRMTPARSTASDTPLERRVFDLMSLVKAGRALHNILDPLEVYDVLLAMVAEKLNTGPLTLLLADEQGRQCRLVQGRDVKLEPGEPLTFPLEQGLLLQNILQYEPFRVTNARGQPLFERYFERHGLNRLQSDLWVPLFLRDRLLGLLTVGRRPEGPDYNEDDLEFLTQLATTAAAAINACQMHTSREAEKQELSRTLRNLSMLYDIGRAMTYISDLKQLLGFILEHATKIAKAKKGSLMLLNRDTGALEVRVIRGLDDATLQDKINNGEVACRTFKPGEGVAGKVFESAETIVVNAVDRNDQFVEAGRSFVDSIACIPMAISGEVIGVINVTNKTDRGPFTPEEVDLLKAVADQAAVAINKAQLWELAVTDSLTGLFIRRYLFTRAAEELGRAQRYSRPVSLIICDIDHFKRVNDSLGHEAGDAVLKNIARILKADSRTVDIVARLGGEEFVLLLPETDKAGAGVVAERLRQKVEALDAPDLTRVTMSFGVATALEDGRDADTLLRHADEALYAAKEGGRNRVEIYRSEPAAGAGNG